MSEGITYDPLGTVVVEFDGETYRLTRPKMKHVSYFTRRVAEISDGARTELADIAKRLEEATDKADNKPTKANLNAQAKVAEEMAEFLALPFYRRSHVVLREMFEQLGDRPLPEDLDEWPAWLGGDLELPGAITNHWRKAPKASGLNGSNR